MKGRKVEISTSRLMSKQHPGGEATGITLAARKFTAHSTTDMTAIVTTIQSIRMVLHATNLQADGDGSWGLVLVAPVLHSVNYDHRSAAHE